MSRVYAPFRDLCLGAKFQYDESKHGEQQKIWVKIYPDLIAEWDPKNIDTCWTGQIVTSFTDKNISLDEKVFIIRD